MKIKILVPIYNDWQSLSKLIDEINSLSLSPEFQLSNGTKIMINGFL